MMTADIVVFVVDDGRVIDTIQFLKHSVAENIVDEFF